MKSFSPIIPKYELVKSYFNEILCIKVDRTLTGS